MDCRNLKEISILAETFAFDEIIFGGSTGISAVHCPPGADIKILGSTLRNTEWGHGDGYLMLGKTLVGYNGTEEILDDIPEKTERIAAEAFAERKVQRVLRRGEEHQIDREDRGVETEHLPGRGKQGVQKELSRRGAARYDQQGGGQLGPGWDQIAQEAQDQSGEEQHAENGGAHSERGAKIRARTQSGHGAEEQKRCGILKQKLSFVHALTSS
jgi:hypothetical protein